MYKRCIRRAFTRKQITRNVWTTKRGLRSRRHAPRHEPSHVPALGDPIPYMGVSAGVCRLLLRSVVPLSPQGPYATWRRRPLLYLSHPCQRLLTETTGVGGHHVSLLSNLITLRISNAGCSFASHQKSKLVRSIAQSGD